MSFRDLRRNVQSKSQTLSTGAHLSPEERFK